ncbi:hypothetical protein N474_23575 [Pseudoalteromonas luteoviolacea CPMOR-2]|uniref:hypothetical protein n=1 Tax=Pseudoalteromonas luteoviolacea TaxID=43657 RepID=UPI0007B03B22|nr:hypothetical protein [Pseudoalteromonas luteoviolacea]KZN52138.1 hypothetical protein N474_23575 [Pseudoalteromonas luteoviolacea CPMOR-2]
MLKELVESFSSNIKERASSPVLGSYTVAAIGCNWKSLVVLFTSEKSGVELVNEVVSVFPGLEQGLIYPAGFAIVFSLLYPSLKAIISTFNTYARIIELKAESRLEDIKERIGINRSDIDSIIESIYSSHEKIGYHDLKRIREALPNEEDLMIKKPNKSMQPTAEASAD